MIKPTKLQCEQNAIVFGWLSELGYFLAINIGIAKVEGQLALGCLIIFCVFGGISSALLLYGICKEKYSYMLPWLVQTFLMIIFISFLCVFSHLNFVLLLFVLVVWITVLIDFKQLKKLQIVVPIIEPTTASV